MPGPGRENAFGAANEAAEVEDRDNVPPLVTQPLLDTRIFRTSLQGMISRHVLKTLQMLYMLSV